MSLIINLFTQHQILAFFATVAFIVFATAMITKVVYSTSLRNAGAKLGRALSAFAALLGRVRVAVVDALSSFSIRPAYLGATIAIALAVSMTPMFSHAADIVTPDLAVSEFPATTQFNWTASADTNYASITQSADTNFASIVQVGAGNYAKIVQQGTHDVAVIKQTGDGNVAYIRQSPR